MTHTPPKVAPEVDEEDLSEITKMHAPRVDLVGGAAVGFDFLMAKSTDNPSMFTEDDVVALAKRAQEGDDMTAKKTAAPAAQTDLTKADLEIDVNSDAVLEVPTIDAEGDAVLDPTSAAWEQLDAARAGQAIELTVALKRLVEQAIARETQEALVGDDIDDADNAWSLAMVADDLDCILGVLAPFAVSEAAEAEDRQTDDSLVLKSVDSSIPLEAGDILLKAGRVLSGVNEGRVQQAHDLLGEVLGTLGSAVPDDGLVKADISDAEITTDEPVDEPIAKADDESQLVLVYSQGGAILGGVKPEDITTFAATPEPETEGDDTAPDDDAAEPVADAPAEPAPDADAPAAATDEAPSDADQPTDAEITPDERVIPGTDTVQAPAEDDEDVKKGQHTDEVRAAVKEAIAPVAQEITENFTVMGELVKSLKDRVERFGKQPDDRNSPTRNGATGAPGEAVRGAGDGNTVEDLRKAIDAETDPEKKRKLSTALVSAEIRSRFTE